MPFIRRRSARSLTALIALSALTAFLAAVAWGAARAQPLAVSDAAVSATAYPEPSRAPYVVGTLLSDHRRAVEEYTAGVRVMHLELSWAQYEPEDGVFDARYAADARERLRVMRAAGMLVVLGIGLQYPPVWVFGYPDSRYVNQDDVGVDVVNLTFNQPLRDRVEQYVHRVDRDLSLEKFWAVRVGSGGLVETLYPPARSARTPNSYWAYDANAQATQRGGARPPSIPASPFPGWRPGQDTYLGTPFSAVQVAQWYDWYLAAMVDGVNWQIATYKRLGFTGYIHVLLPGTGTRPIALVAAFDRRLSDNASDRTTSRAAVWHKVLPALTDRRNVVAYVSSVADRSGNDDDCQPDDGAVPLDDPAVNSWSATRWISYNAARLGLDRNGENPGKGDTRAYGIPLLETALSQTRACGFQGLMWAHDFNLYDGVSGVTLPQLAAAISR